MYRMKSINAMAMISAICFFALETYMFFEMLLIQKKISDSIFGGSLVVLLISLLIGFIFIPITRRYFFYDFNKDYYIVKYYFWEKKFNLNEIKSVEFDKKDFKIFFKDGTMQVEKNRLNSHVYKNFQDHFIKIINSNNVHE